MRTGSGAGFGSTRSYMSRVERGKANPSLDAIETLAGGLKIEVGSFRVAAVSACSILSRLPSLPRPIVVRIRLARCYLEPVV